MMSSVLRKICADAIRHGTIGLMHLLRRGVSELRTYLDRNGLSIRAFCELNGLAHEKVIRVLNGSRGQWISVDFANDIQEATGGKVKWKSWLLQ